jgi:hypothetical protein
MTMIVVKEKKIVGVSYVHATLHWMWLLYEVFFFDIN